VFKLLSPHKYMRAKVQIILCKKAFHLKYSSGIVTSS